MTTENPNVELGHSQAVQVQDQLSYDADYDNDEYLRVGAWSTCSITPIHNRNEYEWQLVTCGGTCCATVIYSVKNSLAVKLRELMVSSAQHEGEPAVPFEKTVERIAAQLSQVLKPFRVCEVDATRKVAIIRTQPRTMTHADTYSPQTRDCKNRLQWCDINSIVGEVRYMELVIKGEGQRVLRQFAFKEQRRRYNREMVMTYETLSHVLDAIAHPLFHES